jgi:hypothetical protein
MAAIGYKREELNKVISPSTYCWLDQCYATAGVHLRKCTHNIVKR